MRPRFYGIALDDLTSVSAHMVSGGPEQRNAHTTSSKFFVNQKANNRPDRLVINSFEDPRARKPNVFLPGRNCAPTDRFSIQIRKDPGDFAVIDDPLHRTAVLFAFLNLKI